MESIKGLEPTTSKAKLVLDSGRVLNTLRTLLIVVRSALMKVNLVSATDLSVSSIKELPERPDYKFKGRQIPVLVVSLRHNPAGNPEIPIQDLLPGFLGSLVATNRLLTPEEAEEFSKVMDLDYGVF